MLSPELKKIKKQLEKEEDISINKKKLLDEIKSLNLSDIESIQESMKLVAKSIVPPVLNRKACVHCSFPLEYGFKYCPKCGREVL